MNYTKNITSCKQNKQNISNLDKNAPDDSLLFSYLITPDTNKTNIKKSIIQNHIFTIKDTFSELVLKKYKDCNDYVNSIYIKQKESGDLMKLDYKISQEYKIKDDINYKNSYINYAYEKLETPTSIFTTNTLKSDYHPFSKNGTTLNPILENTNNPKEAFDKMVFDGYVKLEEAREDFYKQRVFRDDKLTKDKRALILAIEPHKTFVPHTHKLEIIEEEYIKEYIHYTIENHHKFKLGRTEIAIFEKAFNLVKDDYKIVYKDGLYYINDYIYFKVLEQKSDTEIKSISNYMTKYIEQTYIIDGEKKDTKKSSVLYSAFAYYIASLKDRYLAKEDGTKYKKIRRIRYARLLISKSVYRNIMTKEFIIFLKTIGKYHKQNMYLHITKLLEDGELKIYRYYKVDSNTGEIKKDKVYYYDVQIRHFIQRIDVMMNEVYRNCILNGQFKMVNIRKHIQIDIEKETHYIEKYNCKEINEIVIFDNDVL